jgi:hypothetical protein
MKISKTPKDIYKLMFVLANLFLIISTVLFCIYLAAPLLGGTLFGTALIHYGSWIGLGLGMRIVSQRGRKGLWIRMYEYAFLCLAIIVNFILWFPFPIGVVLSILSVIGIAISYRTQGNRKK